MNEFEWRRQMQQLRQPLAPSRDLWASIDAALDDATGQPQPVHEHQPLPRRRWLVGASLAASLLLAGGLGWRLWHTQPVAAPIARISTPTPPPWKPADPRLAGAAIELNAARMELQQAIRQAPDSPALQRLLSRTEHQQTQLRQLASQAG